MMYVCQIIILYTLNLYTAVFQLFNKIERKKLVETDVLHNIYNIHILIY